MQIMPRTVSTYEFKNHTADVSKRLKDGPILLLNRAAPQAVLVDPEQWNTTAERLALLEDVLQAREINQRMLEDESERFSWEDVKVELEKKKAQLNVGD